MSNDEGSAFLPGDGAFNAGRRRVLFGLGSAIAVVAIPASIWKASAATADHIDQATADGFLQLSQGLTGHTNLDPIIARRIYAALALQDTRFVEHCATMVKLVGAQHPTTPEDILTAVAGGPADVTASLHRIVGGWYLGVVSDAPDAEVIAYEKALMFAVVSDVVSPPSYCRAEPGYWTSKPPEA